MSDPLDVLAVMAHPDDAELLCGGALIRTADQGLRAGVVDLTAGEAGTHGTAEVRSREAERAADVMGLATRRSAALPDAGLVNDFGARQVVVALLRELRPRVVITHWVRSRHPDHRAAAELVYDSAYLAGLTRFESPGRPFRPLKVVHALTFREDAVKPTFVVDVSEAMERKMDALGCYGSQFEEKSQAGEVFPGGERPLFEQIRAQMARYGSLIRVPYGEPFWTRETMALDSVTELGVSTF